MALSAHLHQHGLQREHDAPNVLSRNHRQAMLPPRPTFEQNSFFMNASQLDGAPPSGALLGYGVHSAGMKTLMLQRGYTEIKINHLPNDERTAPQSCRGQTQHQLPTEAEEPPSDRVIVPKKLPPMLRGANAPTAAAQVVKQFEHSVKVEEDGKVVVYSRSGGAASSRRRTWAPGSRASGHARDAARQLRGLDLQHGRRHERGLRGLACCALASGFARLGSSRLTFRWFLKYK